MKVLIVGAGPTGLTTALELARQGITPEIVDAKDEPSLTSRAVVLLPRSIEILNGTGVGDKLVEAGVEINAVRIHRGGKPLIAVEMSAILEKQNRITGLAQDQTERLMSEQLARMGVSVRYGTKVTSVTATDTSAEATFANGETRTYDWIVGADGVNSTVRSSLNIPFEGYELDEEWSIADVELNGEGEYDTLNAWLLVGEHKTRDAMVMVPIAQNRVRLISSTPDSLAAVPMKLDVKDVRRSGTFKISVRQADTYVRGRAVLAGDAAHVHSPVGGRGMNLGIEDGQAVAHAILNDALQAYEKERKVKAARTIRATEFARKLAVSNNPFVVVGIYAVAWCVQNIGFIQRRFVRNIVKL